MPVSFRTFPRSYKTLASAAALLSLAACAPNYSPNSYSGNAVQVANKVEPGIVIGFREVAITSNGSVGAVTGGAAGGVLGAQYATDSALGAVGGTTVGALVGTALDHATGDTSGWEYIVRKQAGDMVSVTQKEKKPLELGQKVLVISGPQARVIPDYSVPPPPAEPAKEKTAEAKPPAPPPPIKVEVMLSLPPGMSAQSGGVPITAKAVTDSDVPVQAIVTPVPAGADAAAPETAPANAVPASAAPANIAPATAAPPATLKAAAAPTHPGQVTLTRVSTASDGADAHAENGTITSAEEAPRPVTAPVAANATADAAPASASVAADADAPGAPKGEGAQP